MEISQDKISTLDEFWPLAAFFSEGPVDDPKAWEKVMTADVAPVLAEVRSVIESTEPFDSEHLDVALRGIAEARDLKPKAVFQPLRVAIAGTTVSPGIFESVALLGRDETLKRLDAAARS